MEKYRPEQVWTAILNDAEQKYPYIKRFTFEDNAKRQRYVGDDEKSTLILLTDNENPRFEVRFGGADAHRQPLEIDAEEFIGVKSFKARGKRLTTFELGEVVELEPEVEEEAEADADDEIMDVEATEVDAEETE